jgi:hypothetical protein
MSVGASIQAFNKSVFSAFPAAILSDLRDLKLFTAEFAENHR